MLEAVPRPPRDQSAGVFHVFTHSVWGYPNLFVDDVDRIEFIRHLARASARPGWTCLAFCLMGNHYHLIVEVGDAVLPPAMKDVNWSYARAFNARYGFRGHVQHDRYGSRRIVDEDDLLTRYAYVVNNPVEAGLCDTADAWSWSSHAGTIGTRPPVSFVDPTRVLASIRWANVEPREALRRYVDQRRRSAGLVAIR